MTPCPLPPSFSWYYLFPPFRDLTDKAWQGLLPSTSCRVLRYSTWHCVVYINIGRCTHLICGLYKCTHHHHHHHHHYRHRRRRGRCRRGGRHRHHHHHHHHWVPGPACFPLSHVLTTLARVGCINCMWLCVLSCWCLARALARSRSLTHQTPGLTGMVVGLS